MRGHTPNPVLLSGCVWPCQGPLPTGCPLPITLTGHGPPRLPAARHFLAVGTHTPAGATVLLALDSPEGRRDIARGHRQRLPKPPPRSPSLRLSIFPSFHSCKSGSDWGEEPGDLGKEKHSCHADPFALQPATCTLHLKCPPWSVTLQPREAAEGEGGALFTGTRGGDTSSYWEGRGGAGRDQGFADEWHREARLGFATLRRAEG